MLRLVESASFLISLTNAEASGGRPRCLPRTAAAFMSALTRSLISEDSNSAMAAIIVNMGSFLVALVLVSESFVEAGFANFEACCGLSYGQSTADMGSGLLQLFVGDDRLSSTLSAMRCGGLQSGLCALDNEITLKLGKRTEQMEDQCAAGSCSELQS